MAVAAVAARMDFDVEAIEDIKVAVAEACTNAIEHGCPTGTSAEMVLLRCDLAADALTITVHDAGQGFDPATAERRQRGGTMTLAERGLGMLLIESLMDQVDFQSTPGDGTAVRMVKRMRTEER
jgi:serine/threonine-protein kinase RsbW